MPVQKNPTPAGESDKPGKQVFEKLPPPETVNKADPVAKKGNEVVQENADKLGMSEEDTKKVKETSEKVAKGVDTATDVYESAYGIGKDFYEPKPPAGIPGKPTGAPGDGGGPAGAGGGASKSAGGAGSGKAGTSGGMKRIVAGFKFWVQVDGIQVAGFSECSGLSVETELLDYSEGGLNSYTHKLPVRTKYTNVTLKRGVDETADLQKWYMDTINGKTSRKTVAISLYDHDGKMVKTWELKEAFPARWIAPDLRTDSGATAVETLEFAHSGFSTR